MPTPITEPLKPLTFRIYSDTKQGLLRRTIRVERESQEFYRVRQRDELNGEMKGDVLTGASTTLEKANAQALAINDNYLASVWKKDATTPTND